MHITFGTDGIRTQVGKEPLTAATLVHIGIQLGWWISHEKKNQKIVIAYDTRVSAHLIKSALITGLVHYPIEIIDTGVLPTPALIYHITHKQSIYDMGIMITASHNPFYDNGIKIITKKGKLTKTEELTLQDLFNASPQMPSDYTLLGTISYTPKSAKRYQQAIIEKFPPLFLKNKHLVIDCAHGAFSDIAPAVFQALGATITLIHAHPTGKNINHNAGSLHPESLKKIVLEKKADFGCAFDGDGDRLVLVSRQGIIKNGDDILALLLTHPRYIRESTIVGTIMSNQGLAHYCSQQKKTFIRTSVGDTHVHTAMKHYGTLLGGEPSGHCLITDFTQTSDALYTCLRVLEAAILTKNFLLHTFNHYPQACINMPINDKKDITQSPYRDIIKQQEAQLLRGRLLVRYSGTEPLLRIMVEDETQEHAEEIAHNLALNLSSSLQKEQT